MKHIRTGVLSFFAGFYAVMETAHFGWNLGPKSDAEWIADGISLLLIGMSILSLED